MKKVIFMVIILFVIVLGCKKHTQQIKWEKPGDELIGEWVWTKGTTIYSDHKREETEYGAFSGNPILRMAVISIFNSDGTAEMITEYSSGKTTKQKCTWNVNKDTLKVTFDKDKRIMLCKYQVKENKLIVDRLISPRTIEEYTRD